MTLTTNTEVATLTGGFTVNSGTPVLAISPNSGRQGANNLTVTLAGANFLSGATVPTTNSGIVAIVWRFRFCSDHRHLHPRRERHAGCSQRDGDHQCWCQRSSELHGDAPAYGDIGSADNDICGWDAYDLRFRLRISAGQRQRVDRRRHRNSAVLERRADHRHDLRRAPFGRGASAAG